MNDRTAAEALKHMTLAVPRDRLPPPEDEDDFYHADLIGLRCETAEGAPVGHVAAIHDFGAGDILDIRRDKGPNLTLGFTGRTCLWWMSRAGGSSSCSPTRSRSEAEIDAAGRIVSARRMHRFTQCCEIKRCPALKTNFR